MKKTIIKKTMFYITLAILIINFTVGCTNNDKNATTLASVNIVNENLVVESNSNTNPEEINDFINEKPFDIDSDDQVTALNNDPDFEEFMDMLYRPEDFFGKTVTVNGEYTSFFADYLDRYVHYIFKWDEMGCCPMLMEMMFNNDFLPDDFPQEGAQIEITGVYDSYEEEDFDWTTYYVDIKTLSILDGGNPQ